MTTATFVAAPYARTRLRPLLDLSVADTGTLAVPREPRLGPTPCVITPEAVTGTE
jgi:hypothetical protein